MYVRLSLFIILSLTQFHAQSQGLKMIFQQDGSQIEVKGIKSEVGRSVTIPMALPLISYEVCPRNDLANKKFYTTALPSGVEPKSSGLEISVQEITDYKPGYKAVVTFKNISKGILRNIFKGYNRLIPGLIICYFLN